MHWRLLPAPKQQFGGQLFEEASEPKLNQSQTKAEVPHLAHFVHQGSTDLTFKCQSLIRAHAGLYGPGGDGEGL